MKTGLLTGGLLGTAILLISLASISCAKVVPPTDRQVGPTPTAVLQAPPPAHPVAMEDDCMACHGRDEAFQAALQTSHPVPDPPGFSGTTAQACTLCHKVEPGHNLAKPVPHPVAGMGPCLSCHSGGTQGVTAVPADHNGYTAGNCTECHVEAASQTSSSGTSSTSAAAPAIPHNLTGMGDCVACHAGGAAAIPQMPDGHKGFTNDGCTMCHSATSAGVQ